MRLYVPNVKENTNGEAPEGEEAAAADEKTQAEVRLNDFRSHNI